MALPEQIRKQTEAVQELYKQLNGPTGEGEGNAPTDPTPPADPAPTPEPAGDPAPTNSATDDAAPQSSNEPSGDENSETYAQKWRTLQGMYNAEVPRLHANNRELQSRLSQMEQLISTLSSTPPTQAPAQQQVQSLVSENERAEYGESIDVMRKVSREELTPMIGKIAAIENALNQITASLNGNILPQVQRVAQEQAVSAEDRFWNGLNTTVPQWQKINNDPEFQGWLLEVDPMTGVSRQTYLEQAQSSLDVARVAAFFDTFSKATGKYQANANAQPTRSASANELEKQVTPGRSRSAAAPAGQNTRNYTPDDIRQFFQEVREGRYKGREAERDRIERDIFAAQRDGRIVAHA